MSQVAKTEQAISVPGSRPGAGMRNIAMSDRTEVEELSSQVGVSFNDASFLFRDFGKETLAKKKDPQTYNSTNFTTSSQTFAALFQVKAFGEEGGRSSGDLARRFSGVVSKAIDIYETNARVISGTNNVLGSSFSMTL